MNNRRMIRLLRSYLDGSASREEQARVDKWYDSFQETASQGGGQDETFMPVKEVLYQRIRAELRGGAVIPLYRKAGFRIAVAASLLTVVIAGGWWMVHQRGAGNRASRQEAVRSDITAPIRSRATITLGGGQIITLDSAGAGTLAFQGKMRVVKTADGQIAYLGEGRHKEEVQYNTVSVPRGSQIIQLTLADGTKVWLNSASSLRYPTAFNGADRRVTITGEAYFEVAKDAVHPFYVRVPAPGSGDEKSGSLLDIKVLGTSFNINAYPDETEVKTTLAEGSVLVRGGGAAGGQESVLKPGEQARTGPDGSIRVIRDVSVQKETAWKEGDFFFEGDDLPVIMRQLARWYDVEVEYKSAVNNHFTGIISRKVNVSQVFRMLERTGVAHFTTDGKKIIVTP